MADIELVIKIDEETYCDIKKGKIYSSYHDVPQESVLAIANGTQLPKGHGKLKDIDKIINDGISKGFCDWYDEMKYAETIIRADKSERSEEE